MAIIALAKRLQKVKDPLEFASKEYVPWLHEIVKDYIPKKTKPKRKRK
jgi:hypothetical protein